MRGKLLVIGIDIEGMEVNLWNRNNESSETLEALQKTVQQIEHSFSTVYSVGSPLQYDIQSLRV